jgi:DNA-binding NarL/FixJ family response regulator
VSSPTSLSVVIVEDHPMVRMGVVHTLERAGVSVQGEVTTVAEAYALLGRIKPDAVIVDVRLPDGSGIELTRRLIRRNGHLGIVIYTGAEDAVALKDALDCGARGFVFKTAGPEALVTAVRTVARGGTHVSLGALEQIRHLEDNTIRDRVLSEREREILALLGEGSSGEEIAERLSLSSETVRTHVRNSIRKLNAHNRTHAVVLALQNEEIGLPNR